MRRKSEPTAIADILGQLFKGSQWESQAKRYHLFSRWEEIVGHKVATHSKPEIWRGNILTVAVSSSSWLTELRMMEQDILEKIEATYPDLKIKRIQWKLWGHSKIPKC